jgi:periplasmic protein TonB
MEPLGEQMHSMRAAIALILLCLPGCYAQDAEKRVSRAEAAEAVISKVQPDYPMIAQQLKIQGAVELEAIVSEAGAVEKVNIVSGNPVLTKPAAESLKKWKFKPFLADGKPTRVVAPVSMMFKPR